MVLPAEPAEAATPAKRTEGQVSTQTISVKKPKKSEAVAKQAAAPVVVEEKQEGKEVEEVEEVEEIELKTSPVQSPAGKARSLEVVEKIQAVVKEAKEPVVVAVDPPKPKEEKPVVAFKAPFSQPDIIQPAKKGCCVIL